MGHNARMKDELWQKQYWSMGSVRKDRKKKNGETPAKEQAEQGQHEQPLLERKVHRQNTINTTNHGDTNK